MPHFISKIKLWIEQVDFHNEEQNIASFYVQTMALITITGAVLIGLVYAYAGEARYVLTMIFEITIHSLAIIFTRRKLLLAGSGLFLISNLAILTYGLLSAGGIHASSSILLPVFLIFSSLLLGRKYFILYVCLSIACIGMVIYAENQALTVPYVPDPPEFPLFVSYALILILSSILIRFITESLQSSLRKSRQRENELAIQSAILNRVGQAVVACTNDNTIIFWNSAASTYYGWTAEQVLGKKYQDVIPTSYPIDSADEIRSSLQNGQVWSGEVHVTHRNGKIKPILGSISPLNNQDGTRQGWIGIGADIRELKDAQDKVNSLNAELESRVKARTAELETVVQELDSFSSAIGHDLRSPLRAINGFSKMIIEDHGESLPEDVHQKLIRVEASAKTMGELVDALLNFSRLSRIPMRKSQVNLSNLVLRSLDTHCLKHPRPAFTCQVAENVFADADPVLLQIAIDQLVDNACKFTSRNAEVLIEFGVRQGQGPAVYFLRDNGVGFDMAYSQNLFRPFHRLHHPDEFPGHGIGLVIAQRIIHRHGGSLCAEALPNQGATFYFTLA